MLRHPTLDQLHALGLHGMAKAFADLADADEAKDLAHADWLALLLDRETSWRRDKRLTTRLRAAKLRQQASVEDVDYRAARGLDRALFQKLSDRRMDRRPRQSRPRRPGRRRQELARLRHRPQSLPRQSLRPLSSLAEALRRPGARPRRRPPSAPDQIPRPRRSPHPRRLRPRAPRRRRPSRPPRNPRGAIWPPIDDRHLPAPSVRLARGHRRPHLRRRHPGPPRPQRPSHRAGRREPAPRPRQAVQNGLTKNHVGGRNSLGQQARRPGRDHLVTGGRHHPGIPGRNHPVIDGRLHRNRHLRIRGLGDPLLVVSDGASGIIRRSRNASPDRRASVASHTGCAISRPRSRRIHGRNSRPGSQPAIRRPRGRLRANWRPASAPIPPTSCRARSLASKMISSSASRNCGCSAHEDKVGRLGEVERPEAMNRM